MERRRGTTALELIVVIGIIGLIAAIVLPAIMQARESQRRVSCESQMANLMRAFGNYEAAHSHYPGALEGRHPSFREWYCHFSPFAKLLPHIDQVAIYDAIDFTIGDHVPLDPVSDAGPLARSARTAVPVFACPSDTRRGPLPGNSYRVCLGIGPDYSDHAGRAAKGAFSAGQFRRVAEFRDGMSATIAVGERVTGTWNSSYYSPSVDMWFTGVDQFHTPPLDGMIQLCASVRGTPGEFYAFTGATWLYGAFETTWYNHALPPNSSVPTCSAGVLGDGPRDGYAIVGATSRHAGGVNVALMDGAVRFIADSIDLTVYRSLATIQGGEVIGEF